jgi:hypothetical protein
LSNGPGATPLPITFLGLGMASAVVGGYEAHVLPSSEYHAVGWIVLAIPVPMQLLGAVAGLWRGELAAATASSVLAASWLATALSEITGSSPTRALALLFFAAAAGLLLSVVTEAIEGSFVPAVVLLAAAVRFAVSGVSAFEGTHAWATAAGVVGFAVAGIALAGAFFVEIRSALGRR